MRSHGALCDPILRDNENAYVSVNGKTCWSKTMSALDGTQQCGGFFKEEMFRVTGCYVTLSGSEVKLPVTVRVWTDLDGDAADESFAIGNVVIEEGIAKQMAMGRDSMVPFTRVHTQSSLSFFFAMRAHTHTHVHTCTHFHNHACKHMLC